MDRFENYSPLDYLFVVWRRKWVFIFTAIIVLTAGVFVILNLPVLYRSTALIQVERQEIPKEWVSSTVESYADERIKIISQDILSTSNLAEMISRFNLFPNENHLSLNMKTELMRTNFSIENVLAQISGSKGKVIIAFKLSYDDPSPQVAQSIAAEFASLFLDENFKSRTKSVSDTRRFLESESNRLLLELGEIEKKIADFKEKNLGALPEHQALNIQAYNRIEQEIDNAEQKLDSLEERRALLTSGIDAAVRYIKANNEGSVTAISDDPARKRLDELRSEYLNLQTRYSDVHPDVVRLQREIKVLESQLAPVEAVSTVASVESELFSQQEDASLIQLRTDLQSATNEQNSLRRHIRELVKKQNELEAKINRTPYVEREYRSLIRDQENLQKKFNEIRARQSSARISQSLEEEQKSERLTLTEAPKIPELPYTPNYKKLFAATLGLSFLTSLGTLFGIELIDGTIRNVRAVESLTGGPVLATVGYIEGEKDRRQRRRKIILWFLLIASSVTAVWFYMDFYRISPEDIDFENIRQFIADSIKLIESWLRDTGLIRQ